MESTRNIERAFFTASTYEEFQEKAEKRINQGIISAEDLADARIEEFVLGTYFNFNFFYSILNDRVEFLGIDRRLQTNLNDFTSLPAKQQLEIDIELGYKRGEGIALANIGETLMEMGEYQQSREHLDKALIIFRENG